MTQSNSLNVILSNSQIHNLKSEIKNGTGVTLNLSSNMICDCNMMRLIFQMNYYWLIDTFQGFVKILRIIYQLI